MVAITFGMLVEISSSVGHVSLADIPRRPQPALPTIHPDPGLPVPATPPPG